MGEKRKSTLLSLPHYRELVTALPMPTPLQMQQFAKFVSGAHSWYKHLPLPPPGHPLQFFLNPAAGMQLLADPRGNIEAIPRSERGFHYSWLPTTEYRERFGYLDFSRSSGTSVAQHLDDGARFVGSDDASLVFDPITQSAFQLPEQIMEAGRAFVSGIIHTLGADERFWQLTIQRNVHLDWPEASGGQETVAKIRDRCRLLLDNPSQLERAKLEDLGPNQDVNLRMIDFPLYQILEPERQRQRAGMVAAMKRVLEITFGDSER